MRYLFIISCVPLLLWLRVSGIAAIILWYIVLSVIVSKKKDFENVIEYYRTVNLPFVMHLEKDYRSLTPSNMFMLLLAEELKYNDAKIAECMMMSPGALRTAKSRINSRHLGQGKD